MPRAFLLLGAALLTTLAGCTVAAVPCRLTLDERIPVISIAGDQRVMLPVTVDNRPARLLLDTGSDTTVLTDAAFRRVSGLEDTDHQTTISGVGGLQTVQGTSMWRFAVGVLASSLSIVVMDHSILPPIPPTDGLLGLDAFGNDDIDLDLRGGSIGLYRPVGDCTKPHSLLAGRSFSLSPASDSPGKARFHVHVLGQDMIAELDTGAPNTVLFASAAARLGLSGVGSDRVHGVGQGIVLARNIRLASIGVGPLLLRDMPATMLDQDVMDPVDLLLGMDFVRLAHVWLSAASHTVILQYPPQPTLPTR